MENERKTSNKCLILREFGHINKFQIQDRPIPQPGKDQIRIRVEAWSASIILFYKLITFRYEIER